MVALKTGPAISCVPLRVRSSALAILTRRSIMSATTTAPQPAAVSPLRGLLIRHPLVSFFTLAYALTWLAWSPWYLSEAGIGLLPFDGEGISDYLNTVALIVGPTLSAFIMTGATEGREGVRGLLRRIVLWRVGLGWYLFVLLGIPAIILLSTVFLPGALASFEVSAVPSTLFLYVVAGPVLLFIGGPVFEEIGWRGFALPRLQRLHGPLVGTLILGALWGLWHLPPLSYPILGHAAREPPRHSPFRHPGAWVHQLGRRIHVRPLSHPCRHRRHRERRDRLRGGCAADRGPDPRPPRLPATSERGRR